MSKLLSLKIADRLQPIVLSFSKGTGTVRGASIDLRELAGSTGSQFTDGRAARRWNSQTSGCEYSRWKEVRGTPTIIRLALNAATNPQPSQLAYAHA
jgi:hypothetical protein